MRKLAIIPARGGSKRIEKKNIRSFCGKPILKYPIEAALRSELFDEVMVSTDDAQIAEIARTSGAVVPFLRSEKNSNDFAGTEEVLLEVIDGYLVKQHSFDYGCCIYPTAPFVTPELLKETFKRMLLGRFDSIFSVIKYAHPVQRALKMEDGRVTPISMPDFNKRSQDLSDSYHDAGQFYWFSLDAFIQKKQILTDNSCAFEIPAMHAHDIDNEEDWAIAEFKYSWRNKERLASS